ncbi:MULTISPECIES: phosphoglycerate mutase family protein [Legionella]|uniref:Phosphoglycerate mutase family protein n=1 Tax=Legionella septentrionalis TaxID=2498109 RepID=A0A3S0WQR2_9GAMM|nr:MULTISPECIES: phosphoglycerate mutase family protein [Legionella]MCP0913164.1 histidine phosphatase family protein [Legionella sp. 27cVA30]RUQ81571.1 phosphoglycerate mutase family protein [Legionella septentrionalis]RUR02452.1 phosphoglycerate mutase family protein [Legionella septentrionalis]RUR09309.1 phosphoglycerate mutase family protein [Legionella septentrionalis]RUR17110.1 phosphoglycerate mutase family protein [Legionella septentrionalis]
MPDLNLWLIRHGETEVNSGTWSKTPNETCLTARGIEQARKSAAQILRQPDLFIVSPVIRAQQTSEFFTQKWPKTPTINLPIQEFAYLSSQRLGELSQAEIQANIKEYWQKCDPLFCDGKDAESFADFLKRVFAFYQAVLKMRGFVIAIGHGQFFKAFQLGLTHSFTPDANWMRLFRKLETLNPIMNGEIIKLDL